MESIDSSPSYGGGVQREVSEILKIVVSCDYVAAGAAKILLSRCVVVLLSP